VKNSDLDKMYKNQIGSFISELYTHLNNLFTMQRHLDDEIPLCTQIIEQVLYHEKAKKLLNAFTASTSNLYAQDLKHVRINSMVSEKTIYKEVEQIRSLIDEQRFEFAPR